MGENTGTVSNAWHFVANDFEQTAEIHKAVAGSVLEEIAKPMKVFGEIQYRTRKNTEAIVEKRYKQLQDWRTTEGKAKAKSYLVCRDNEKCQDQLLDCKLGRGRQLSDKEHVKLQTKRKKSEAAVRKSDMEYYAANIKAERSRLDWEGAVKRGVAVFKRLEEERLGQLCSMSKLYLSVMENNRPKLVNLTERLKEPIEVCHVGRDVQNLKIELDDEGIMGQQILPHFYCEDMLNVMNKERRREALAKVVGIIKADAEREKKGRAGVKNLAKALKDTPNFGGEESQQDVQDKLQHMRAMMTYLEASRYKALNVMMDVEGRPRVSHPMSSYIDYGKDKQGLTQSMLRIPHWVRTDPLPPTPEIEVLPTGLDWSDRGTADGGSPDSPPGSRSPHLTTSVGATDHNSPVFTTVNPIICNNEAEDTLIYRGTADGGVEDDDDDQINISDINDIDNSLNSHSSFNCENGVIEDTAIDADSDFDDFDSDDEEASNQTHGSQDNEIQEIYYQEKQVAVIGQCSAIYDYTADMHDELSIRHGDIINIHDKQEDGWWLGECEGNIGIFPATYVEHI